MRKRIALLFMLFASQSFGQQLPQFSQYNRNQFLVNPGAAGVYEFTDIAVGGRYQWAGFENAPKTAYAYGAGIIGNRSSKASLGGSAFSSSRAEDIKTGKIKHALGGQMIMDEYGAFRKLSFAGSYAIHMPVSRDYNISFGTKLGISNNTFIQDRAVVLTEMPNYSGAPTNDEAYSAYLANQSSVNHMDLGMGFYFYSKDLFVGVAADQLTRDFVSFGSGTANFDPTMHFHITAGYKFELNNNMTLMPSVLAKIMAPAPLSIEGNVLFEYKKWLWFGFGYRHEDAVMAMLGCNVNKRFKVGYSFDFSTSRFNQYSSGGHELMLGLML